MLPWNQSNANNFPEQMNQNLMSNPMPRPPSNRMMGNFTINPGYQMSLSPAAMVYQQPFMQQPMYQPGINSFNNQQINPMLPPQPPTESVMPPRRPPEPPPNAPPPPPSDDVNSSLKPPPPDSEEQWWLAELNSLQGASREELERLTQAQWFLAMSTSQQIECWQHKMQLKTKNDIIDRSRTSEFIKLSSPVKKANNAEIDSNPVSTSAPASEVLPASEWNMDNNERPEYALKRCQSQLDNLQKQGEVFEKQYSEWRGQFDEWKAKHENHPNKAQFMQYEKQWVTWQEQMLNQKQQNEVNKDRLLENIKQIKEEIADSKKQTHQTTLEEGNPPRELQKTPQNDQDWPSSAAEISTTSASQKLHDGDKKVYSSASRAYAQSEMDSEAQRQGERSHWNDVLPTDGNTTQDWQQHQSTIPRFPTDTSHLSLEKLKSPQNQPNMPGHQSQMPRFRQQMARSIPHMAGFRQQLPRHSQEMPGNEPNMLRQNVPWHQPEAPGPRLDFHRQRPDMQGQRQEMPGQRPEMPGQRQEMPGQRPEIPGQRPEMPGQLQEMHVQRQEIPGGRSEMRMQRQGIPGGRPEMRGQRQEMYGQRPYMAGQRPQMPGQRPQMPGQRPQMPGKRPPMSGQRPPMSGQRPPMSGQRPPMSGQRPPMSGQRPHMPSQRPQMHRPEIPGQRPEMQGNRPEMQGQRPEMHGPRLRPNLPHTFSGGPRLHQMLQNQQRSPFVASSLPRHSLSSHVEQHTRVSLPQQQRPPKQTETLAQESSGPPHQLNDPLFDSHHGLQPAVAQSCVPHRPKVYNELGIEENSEDVFVDGEAVDDYYMHSQHDTRRTSSSVSQQGSLSQQNCYSVHNIEVEDFSESCVVVEDSEPVHERPDAQLHQEQQKTYSLTGAASDHERMKKRHFHYNASLNRDQFNLPKEKNSVFRVNDVSKGGEEKDSPNFNLHAAEQLAKNNPLFSGENMKKLQEQLKVIAGASGKEVPKPDGKPVASNVNDEKVLEKAKSISNMDLKNILSAVRRATSDNFDKSASDGSHRPAQDGRFSTGGRSPVGRNADPLLDSLQSLASIGALEDDLVLQEYLKLNPQLEDELYLRAMQDKDLLQEAQLYDDKFTRRNYSDLRTENFPQRQLPESNRDWLRDDRTRFEDRPPEPPLQDYVYPPNDCERRAPDFAPPPRTRPCKERSPLRDLRDADQRALERRSIERDHDDINRGLATVQQHLQSLDGFSRGSEEERHRREKSLERLRMRENELFSRERDLLAREEMLRDALRRFSPSRYRRRDASHEGRPLPHADCHEGRPPPCADRHEGRPPLHADRHEGRPPPYADRHEGRPPLHADRHEGRPPLHADRYDRADDRLFGPPRQRGTPPREHRPRPEEHPRHRYHPQHEFDKRERRPPSPRRERSYMERMREAPKERSPARRGSPRSRKSSRSRTPPLKDEFGRDTANRSYSSPRPGPPRPREEAFRARADRKPSPPRRRSVERRPTSSREGKPPTKRPRPSTPPPQPNILIKPTGRPLTFADVSSTARVTNVDDIVNMPGRLKRPAKLVVIMRGLPGSGKTHIAKMIRDKEGAFGVSPRVLGLDDYFMAEVEKVVTEDGGRATKKKVLEYEYEEEMESSYRSNLIRSFKKTLEDGYFTFVIIDAINDKVEFFEECYDTAKTAGFEVYVAEIQADEHECARRNVHNRSLAEVQKLRAGWEETPSRMNKLDLRMLIQDGSIQEVEMGDITDSEEEGGKEEPPPPQEEPELVKSKWENEAAQLDKLDGVRKKPAHRSMDDFLSVTDDYSDRQSAPGKKRVRWADMHERENQRRIRDVGFVVGQTDWSRMMDDSHATQALNRTKFI